MHKTPVFMRVLENPVVRNNAALGGLKSMEKLRFSTIFLGFCGYLAENAVFSGFFRLQKPEKPSKYGQILRPSLSPISLNAARKAPFALAQRRLQSAYSARPPSAPAA